MYNFSIDMLEKALINYTIRSCDGKWDDEFYIQASYETFIDPALAACVIMDYIDDLCEETYQKNVEEFLDNYKTTLDGEYPMGC
jgi:hypothetical protein